MTVKVRKTYQIMICFMKLFTFTRHREPDTGLDYLLDLDGNIEVQNGQGYWIKMDACRVEATPDRPHGIRYSLTLHAPDGRRLVGYDNAHPVRPPGSRFKHAGRRYPFDHRHPFGTEVEVLYEFDTAYQLLSDFYAEVDKVLKQLMEPS